MPSLHFLFPHAYRSCGFDFLISIEGTQSSPPPACHEIGRAYLLVFVFFLLPSELCGKLKESTQHRSAIVAHQFDETGFPNQPPELNKMAGAGASVLHPLPLIITSLIAVETITQHGQAF